MATALKLLQREQVRLLTLSGPGGTGGFVLDNSGIPGLAVTNFDNEMIGLYRPAG